MRRSRPPRASSSRVQATPAADPSPYVPQRTLGLLRTLATDGTTLATRLVMGLLHAVGRNRLLEALPEDVFARMKGALEKVSFDIQTILYGADNVIDYVFFPSAVSCRWSSRWRTAPPSRSAPSETKAWWALQCSSAWSAVRPRRSARSPGIACGCQPAAFKKELAEEDRILHQLVSKYAQAMINHISQSVACNHLHSSKRGRAAGS